MDGVACSVLDRCITDDGGNNPEEFTINYDFFLLKKSSTGVYNDKQIMYLFPEI